MKKMLIRSGTVLLILILAIIIFNFNKNETFAGSEELSSDAEKTIKYLLADWRKQYRSTDIATAMDNIGLKQDDELRLQIGEYFRENTRLAGNLRFWGPNNYLLSHTEKIITKYLMHKIEREGGYPTIAETVKDLDIDEITLKERLAFMKRAGILVSANNRIKYSLANNYKTWGGPLRYNSHIITVEGEKPFGVW